MSGQPFVAQADASVADFARVRLDARTTIGMSAYGNAQTTLIALRALFNAAEGDFELLLVDDCSPDGGETRRLFEQTAREHANTHVYAFDRNHEYSGSLNCILSHARGERVLFVSNDIFVTPGYLRGLLAAADADPSHGVVRGCSNFVDNGLATHNLAVPRIASSADLFALGERTANEHGAAVLDDEFLTGDAFLVTRAVLERVGTFDPLFYGYFADHDFGVRARCAGFRMLLARGAFAWHQQQVNISYLPPEEQQAKLQRRWSRVHENWARFKLKYRLPVEAMYEGMHRVPWQRLSSEPFSRERHYVAPGDYARDEIAVTRDP